MENSKSNEIFLKFIANKSKMIIRKPLETVGELDEIVNYGKVEEELFDIYLLSLLKIFKNLITLRKSKKLRLDVENKNKWKIKVRDLYIRFVDLVLSQSSLTSVTIAVELLSLEHFDCITKIVKKIVKSQNEKAFFALAKKTKKERNAEFLQKVSVVYFEFIDLIPQRNISLLLENKSIDGKLLENNFRVVFVSLKKQKNLKSALDFLLRKKEKIKKKWFDGIFIMLTKILQNNQEMKYVLHCLLQLEFSDKFNMKIVCEKFIYLLNKNYNLNLTDVYAFFIKNNQQENWIKHFAKALINKLLNVFDKQEFLFLLKLKSKYKLENDNMNYSFEESDIDRPCINCLQNLNLLYKKNK